MLILTKRIKIPLPNEYRVHSYLKGIPLQEYEGWNITRKGNSPHINFKLGKTTNVGIFALKLKTVWDDLTRLEPNLKKFHPDLTKCWVIRMLKNGGLFTHIDYKRDRALMIPVGPNKGEIHYHMHWKWKPFYTYQYKGPTLTRTNVTHSVKNTTGDDRYVIQIIHKQYEDTF